MGVHIRVIMIVMMKGSRGSLVLEKFLILTLKVYTGVEDHIPDLTVYFLNQLISVLEQVKRNRQGIGFRDLGLTDVRVRYGMS